MGVNILPENTAEAKYRVTGGKQGFTSANSVTQWQRPADWLAMPSVSESDEKFVGLYAVTNDNSNFVALTAQQYAFTSVTSSSSSTDANSYTTASVTLTPGRLYILSVENSHATDAPLIGTITGSVAGVPAFNSRGTIQFNSNLNRLTVLSVVPTLEWTGTLTINFDGTTQTGACWSLVVVDGIKYTTDDGIVQLVTNTGSSGTSSAVLSALSHAGNFTFAAQAHAGATSSTPGTGFTEIHDVTASTPAQALQTMYSAPNTGGGTLDASSTFTSAAWGVVAIELSHPATGYQVDWGDGTVENFNLNTTAYHQYTYSSISSLTNSSRGYRQALVTVTAKTGESFLTGVNLNVKHNQTGLNAYETKWLDTVFAGSLWQITIGSSSIVVRMRMLENVNIISSKIYSLANFFSGCAVLQSVQLNASPKISTMSSMFSNCYALQNAPFFDTSAATNMSSMFNNCFALETIPLLNTSSVTNMSSMFNNCYELETIPLLNTSSVTNMSSMFNNCYSLQTVPLYNTSSATNMSNMFQSCYSLKTVPLLNMQSATSLVGTFQNCYALETAPAFNMLSASSTADMFRSCYSLKEVGALNMPVATTLTYMFASCINLDNIPTFNMPSASNIGNMFNGCSKLKTIALFDTSTVTDVGNTFANCSSLVTVPAFNTSSLISFSAAFPNCLSLVSIPAFDLSKVTQSDTSPKTLSGNTSLASCSFTGLRTSMDISQCNFSKEALETFFTNLGSGFSAYNFPAAPTVTISSNWGTTSTSLSGTTTAGSTTVTMASTTGLSTGMEISGTGISDSVTATLQDAGDTFTRASHGLSNGDQVGVLSLNGAGGGVALNTSYYVVNKTANTFQVADTAGGSAKAISATPKFSGLTSGSDSTDASTYTTASVTLTAGRLYLLTVENSHGTSASTISSITGSAGGVPTFASRVTQIVYDNNLNPLNRLSIWSAVPASNWTGTLTINFGGTTQTGVCWSLVEVANVDTTTNNGIVTSLSTYNQYYPSAIITASALGQNTNALFCASATSSAITSTYYGRYSKIHDVTASTPAQSLSTAYQSAISSTDIGDRTIYNYLGVYAALGVAYVEVKAGSASVDGDVTICYPTTITAITPNTNITLSVPATASGTVTTVSSVLKRSIARMKGFTVTG